jgi:hypothetical protein
VYLFQENFFELGGGHVIWFDLQICHDGKHDGLENLWRSVDGEGKKRVRKGEGGMTGKEELGGRESEDRRCATLIKGVRSNVGRNDSVHLR